MKKIQLILGGLLLPFLAYSGVTSIPKGVKYEKGVYAIKMSPNGKWIGSMAGDASIYNVETGENIYYTGNFLGIGNVMANNGMAVADANDRGTILYQGRTIFPETLGKFWFCDINAITPDATRIAGICNNTKSGVTYVPFVADMDENGNVGEPVILPFPEVDFFRATPQSATVVWMSDDGKTCLGQLVDWRGMYTVPIYYKQDDKGEWDYFLPTKPLFNPTGIEIPDNPWLTEPNYPEPQDVMDPIMREAYQNKYDEWVANGCVTPEPDYTAYMTDEEYEKYKKLVEEYNGWYEKAAPFIREYVPIYQQVLETTPSFAGNDVALARSGEFFLTPGGVENKDGDIVNVLYKIYTDGRSEMKTYKMPDRGLYPSVILPDGTAILTKGMRKTPDSYMFNTETGEFTYVNDYLRPDYPEIVEWIEENFPYGNGYILMNDDKTFITGALTPGQFVNYDWDNDYYYNTYFIGAPSLTEEVGIETIVSPDEDIYRAYNLQGVKVMETKDAKELNSLPKGLYIINGKKIAL